MGVCTSSETNVIEFDVEVKVSYKENSRRPSILKKRKFGESNQPSTIVSGETPAVFETPTPTVMDNGKYPVVSGSMAALHSGRSRSGMRPMNLTAEEKITMNSPTEMIVDAMSKSAPSSARASHRTFPRMPLMHQTVKARPTSQRRVSFCVKSLKHKRKRSHLRSMFKPPATL
mmetsp:Transcript_23496/g.35185  ORF Transcript_23496/g.35185 Transcript_23496/m.35185 type:complete len:173 (-) Transcript_23496:141-659(-)